MRKYKVVISVSALAVAFATGAAWAGNVAEVYQDGEYSSATISQYSGDSLYGYIDQYDVYGAAAAIDQTGYYNDADIIQYGIYGGAAAYQSGESNYAYIGQGWYTDYALAYTYQYGYYNQAYVLQDPSDYAYGMYAYVFQSGEGNYAFVSQYAPYAYASVVQSGNYNTAYVTQSYGSTVLLTQEGDYNYADIYDSYDGEYIELYQNGQTGDGNYAEVYYDGTNSAYAYQDGSYNTAYVYVLAGDYNWAGVDQYGTYNYADVEQSYGAVSDNQAYVYQAGYNGHVAYITQGAEYSVGNVAQISQTD